MSKISNTVMKLKKSSPPLLDDGIYEISVMQQVFSPEPESFQKVESKILVSHPHFSILPDEVYTEYPSTGMIDDFSNTLPHIVLNREVTPWVHSEKPWLALICLKDEEVVEKKTMTIKEFLSNDAGDVFSPIGDGEEFLAEDPSDFCNIIDIQKETFENVMPAWNELDYLAHARKTYMGEKEDILTQHPGLFSVVVGNRFIPSAEEQPVKSTAYLVSVEFWYDYLRQGDEGGFQSGKAIPKPKARLVVLHQWEIISQTLPYQGFRQTFTKLDFGAFCDLKNEAEMFQRGYVPKLHITRSGEKTVSLYRGPLAPYDVKKHENKFVTDGRYSGDGYLKYDPENGVFDTTYSVAWQLGRLMAIKRKKMADEIFHWKRSQQNKSQIMFSKNVMASNYRAFVDDDARKEELTRICKHMLRSYQGGEKT